MSRVNLSALGSAALFLLAACGFALSDDIKAPQRTVNPAAKTGADSMKVAPSAPQVKKGKKKIKNPCIKTADGLVCPPELPPPPKTPSGL